MGGHMDPSIHAWVKLPVGDLHMPAAKQSRKQVQVFMVNGDSFSWELTLG